MVENEFNENPANRDLSFTAGSPIYQAKPDADANGIANHLGAKLGQLSAMPHLIFDEGLGRFNNMNETAQYNYLWSCAMVADKCK